MSTEIGRLAEALWRSVTYVSVAQLHLRGNPLLTAPLTPEHVKGRPAGHWGTVPGAAFALSNIALAGAASTTEFLPVLGAGHAGVVQAALAWITGHLGEVRPQFGPDIDGLTRLVRSFPHLDGLGAEVNPLLPAGAYMGGQIGGALAFATGAALDAPGRLVVPVIGDGECETPTTAAAWLAAKTLAGRAMVLPIVHVNGQRMGATSLLAGMDDDELRSYAHGLGWDATIVSIGSGDIDEHDAFHEALVDTAAKATGGEQAAIFLRCVKGWTGPAIVDGELVLGTARVHKTPISDPHGVPQQFTVLKRWLASYRPWELFDLDGSAAGDLAVAVGQLGAIRPRRVVAAIRRPLLVPSPGRFRTFADAVTTVLRAHADTGNLRVFSPDELASNRLAHLAGEPWCVEVLAEEVLLGWLAGWTATGRAGLLISYEAFAPLLATGLAQLLKQRRLLGAAAGSVPSLNLLLTSYGWHNTYTHGDPSLITMLLATRDPAVRVLTPADPARLAVALDAALSSSGQVNVIVAGKHTAAEFPIGFIGEEISRGLATWSQVSDPDPDLVLVVAGDLPAEVACAAAPILRRRYGIAVRVVGIMDLSVLGDPATWPLGIPSAGVEEYLPAGVPVIIATLGHPAAIWALLEGRLRQPVEVIGWCEPPRPVPQNELAALAGMDTSGFCAAVDRFISTGALNIPNPRAPQPLVAAAAIPALGLGDRHAPGQGSWVRHG